MEQRLTLITLGVSDLKQSAKFYLDGLGWKATQDSSEHIIFIQMNGFTLSLYPHDQLAADATVEEDRSNFRGFTLAYNVSNPSQVDQVLDFAKQASRFRVVQISLQPSCLVFLRSLMRERWTEYKHRSQLH